MKEPTKEQIEQAKKVHIHYLEACMKGIIPSQPYSDWLDDKLKQKEETFEKFEKWWRDSKTFNDINLAYKDLRKEVFAKELKGTQGLDDAIAFYGCKSTKDKITPLYVYETLLEIKSKLEAK